MSFSVSIIIPIFNVQPYVHTCIDSVLAQYGNNNELLLIDDGSTDGSDTICDEYARTYNNVQVIHKSNGGLSDARNVGTELAQGEYIFYLDSDDWLVPDAIERLYQFAVDLDCGVVQGGFYYAFNDHLEYDNRWLESTAKPFVLSRSQAMAELVNNNYVKNFAWGKLYKASLVKRHKFPFGKFYEDSYWQHLIINDVDIYGVLPEPLYYYRQRGDSISGRTSERILDLYSGLEQRLSFLIENYPDLVGLQADKLWTMAFSSRNRGASFRDIFLKLDAICGPILSESFKQSIFYGLASKESCLLPAYQFINRVWNHFTAKRLQRIDLTQ